MNPHALGVGVVSSLEPRQATGNREGKRDIDSEVRKINCRVNGKFHFLNDSKDAV